MGNVVCEKNADMFGEGGVFEEVILERDMGGTRKGVSQERRVAGARSKSKKVSKELVER